MSLDVAYDDAGRPSPCDHEQIEARIRTLSNGTQAPYWQCLTCGSGVRSVRRDEAQARQEAQTNPPFDLELRDAWDAAYEHAWSAYSGRMARSAGQKSASWWDDYEAYLISSEWRAKRQRRLELDRFECQARLSVCERRATQVHHLSYRHLRNEPMFELTSVCTACHDAITSMDRGRDTVV